ncbi:peptidyl-prolyl cis-trans isomerase, partial [Aggregatibacter actinomycetemcomitans serotype d str. SA3733]
MNLKFVLFAAIGFFVLAAHVHAEEKVVATVNGIPILESQVQSAINKKTNDRQAALNKVIDDILVDQAVKESDVKVNNAQIDQIIEGIAAQNGLTFGQLLDALDYQGISYRAYRQQIAQQVMMSEVRNHAISQSVDVSREQVEALAKKMLDEAKAKGSVAQISDTQYEVRHILLKLNP